MVGTFNLNSAYMDMLSTLPNEDKLDLISMLVNSMKKVVTKSAESNEIFDSFSKDWGGDMTTEDYADMLRSENIENTRTVTNW